MSHILEGLDQGPPKPNQSIPVLQRHTVAEPEGSQNGRPHFERFPMRIVTIPVHRDVPELVRNRNYDEVKRWAISATKARQIVDVLKANRGTPNTPQPFPTFRQRQGFRPPFRTNQGPPQNQYNSSNAPQWMRNQPVPMDTSART